MTHVERNFLKSTHSLTQFAQLPKDYAGLCRLLMPRPIRDKVDLENVMTMTDAVAGHKLTTDQKDYFDLLCRLVEDCERVCPSLRPCATCWTNTA